MPKYPSTETIFSKHHSVCILKPAESASPLTRTVWKISTPMQFPQSCSSFKSSTRQARVQVSAPVTVPVVFTHILIQIGSIQVLNHTSTC